MVNVLHSKRESSRFQILVEMAAHQPDVRQKEVAERLGVTTQAISVVSHKYAKYASEGHISKSVYPELKSISYGIIIANCATQHL